MIQSTRGRSSLFKASRPSGARRRRAGTGNQDGVENDRAAWGPGAKVVGDGGDRFSGAQHPDLYACGRQVGLKFGERWADKARNRLNLCDTKRRLDGQGGDACCSEEAVCGENLKVGRDAGARRRVETGNREGDMAFCWNF